MRKKLNGSGGFSFVEMLCAVVILVLLVLMMNAGIGMAVNSYQKITAKSETELLVNSISDALADKLRYCVVTKKDVVDGAPDEYTVFITQESDIASDFSVQTVDPSSGQLTVDGKSLLPNGAYGNGTPTGGGYIEKYTVGRDGTTPLVTYVPATNSFQVKFIVKAANANISRTAEFTVRCLNPVKKEVVH